MGCTETKSDDENYGDERDQRSRGRSHNNYQEEEEIEDQEEFKDFEELGSKNK